MEITEEIRWLSSSEDGEGKSGSDNSWRQSIRAAISNTHLVIIAGSGCSYGLTNGVPESESAFRKAPMMSDLLDRVRKLPEFGDVEKLHKDFSSIDNVETLLSSVQAAASLAHGGGGGGEESLLRAATREIRDACNFVAEETDLSSHEMLIRKLAFRESRQDRLDIFTTNYDLAFETALASTRVMAIDGFGYGSSARFSGENFNIDIVNRSAKGTLDLAPNVVRLLKLHGSVDWDERPGGVFRCENPANPVLIYPSTNKYQQSYRQPFIESMARLQEALRRPNTTIFTIGFGFNDDHISQPILDALTTEPTVRMVAVCPDILETETPAVVKLRDAVSAGDGRITLLSCTMKKFATLLPEQAVQDKWQEFQNKLVEIWSGR